MTTILATVASDTRPKTFYQVVLPTKGYAGHCTCPDFFYRAGPTGHVCKHLRRKRDEALMWAAVHRVPSETTKGVTYTVVPPTRGHKGHCTCLDFKYRGRVCKHQRKVM